MDLCAPQGLDDYRLVLVYKMYNEVMYVFDMYVSAGAKPEKGLGLLVVALLVGGELEKSL